MSEVHHSGDHDYQKGPDGTTYYVLPKVVHSTREQLDALHIPLGHRDQCVDFLVVLKRCRAEPGNGTNAYKCGHEKHLYEQCAWELMKRDKFRL